MRVLIFDPSCDPVRTAQKLNFSATDFTDGHRFFDKFVPILDDEIRQLEEPYKPHAVLGHS
jgi:hypothetical protein